MTWTGNRGVGTTNRRAYSRDTETTSGAKPLIVGSSDPAFRGDAARWNPEELLLVSLSQCHLLWYLDLAARAGVVVVAYVDDPVGAMAEEADGSGRFTAVTLRPAVTITDPAKRDIAAALHTVWGSRKRHTGADQRRSVPAKRFDMIATMSLGCCT